MNKLLLGGSDFSSPLMWLRGNQSNQETLLCSAIKIKKTLLNTARYYSTGKHYHFNVEYFSYLRLIDILTAFMSSSSSLFIHTIIFFFQVKQISKEGRINVKNDHIKEKCHPWKEPKIGGRSATVPHHTHLL